MTWSESSFQVPQPQCGNNCIPPPPFVLCNFGSNFNFTDMDGGSHNLALGVSASNGGIPPPGGGTTECPAGDEAVPQATDGEVWAFVPNTQSWVTAAQGWNAQVTQDPQILNGSLGTFTVTDKEGNTYFFGGSGSYNSGARVFVETPYQIEDRNGNQVTMGTPPCASSGFMFDTLCRPIIAAGQNGQQVIGGITYPFPALPPGAPSSTTVSYNSTGQFAFSAGWGEVVDCPQNNFGSSLHVSDTVGAAWTLPLPDSTQYTFYNGQYNPNDSTLQNNFGLVNEVVFPNGGWIKYWWAMSTGYQELGTFSGLGEVSHTAHPACFTRYTVPVLAKREVSYDGVSLAQTQTFAYTTNWNETGWQNNSPGGWTSKITTVQTTDNIQNKTSQIVYTYIGGAPAGGQFQSSGGAGTEIPLEASVQYYDWGNTTTPIKTEYKGWLTENQMYCDITTIGGLTAGHFFQWNTTYGQISDEKDYDFGKIPTSSYSLTSGCGGTAPSGFTRETVTNYKGITNSVGATFGKPSSVIVKDSSGNTLAETDYAYDESSPTSANAVQHDPAYGTGMLSRGNPTTITQKCIGNPCPPGTVTKLTYDITGQVISMTDSCGVQGCSLDMPAVAGSTHVTQYSYADSGTNLPSSPGSNAYLTKITYPQTGSVVHKESFAYNYTFGDLSSLTDENGNVTSYLYEPLMDRLAESDFPDGGKTTITYNGESSVSTTQLIWASPLIQKTTTTLLDGMFHATQNQLTSDPDAPNNTDYTDTTYDGEGNAASVSNPYRSTPLPTDGKVQTVRDGLGRPTQVTEQDGSVVRTLYEEPCIATANVDGTTVVDEAGNVRVSCTDGYGRLVEVDEALSVSQGSPGSVTLTIAGNEQGPVNSCPPNNCPFYDQDQ